MTRKRRNVGLWHGVGAVGWPVLLGGTASSLFYAALERRWFSAPLLERYCTGHPISISETVLFFIGLAALVIKCAELLRQRYLFGQVPLESSTGEEADAQEAQRWIELIDNDTRLAGRSWLAQRVLEALHHVVRNDSSAGLDETLRHLAEKQEQRQYESYALVRIVIWAIPMLGFLGTVIGIARALGNLDPNLLATAPAQAMQGLLSGLYVAFDTTALALSLSIGLMFFQFPVERVETHLGHQITDRAAALLVGRFRSGSRDPQLAAIERMSYGVIRATENLIKRQAELWLASLEESRQAWRQHWDRAGATLQQSLSSVLDSVLERHRQQWFEWENQIQQATATRWQQWQTELEKNRQLLEVQLEKAQHQIALLERLVSATGDIMRLEDALNANLGRLAEAQHFEETVMSLAAAIQLLAARLQPSHDLRRVDLRSASRTEERAA